MNRISKRSIDQLGGLVERAFAPIDVRLIRRKRVMTLVPRRSRRSAGKVSYGEWALAVGLMPSLMSTELDLDQPATILDVGCGSALVAVAAEPCDLAGLSCSSRESRREYG